MVKLVIVIFVVCLAGAFANEILKAHKEACRKETGLAEGVFEDAIKNATPDTDFDEDVACFGACLMQKLGLEDEEGKLEENNTRAFMSGQLPDDLVNVAIEDCKNQVGENQCETAGKLMKCFVKNNAVISV